MKKIVLFLFAVVFLCRCTDFEYSPHQVFDGKSSVALNNKNLARLLQTPADDTLRFVVAGDSQAAENDVSLFVKTVNGIPGIDLIFLAGDISEFGALQEMEWLAGEFKRLKAPYLGVIGNHDLLGNGSKVFERMFGARNYAFVYGGVKFVCHDTNSREYNFNGKVPDIDWLKSELAADENVNFYIPVAHVRPYTTDFDASLSTPYTDALNSNPKTLASFYAHDHSFGEYRPNNSRIPLIVTTSLGERGFLLVEIVNGQLTYERINF